MTASKHLPTTSESLPIVLLRARESVMAPIRAMLSSSDVTEQQWRILRVLSEHGPQDAKTVAEKASLLFPSLTRTATVLRRRGLITQAQDQQDRRRQVLAITGAGQAVIDENLAHAVAIAQGYREKLGESDYAQLLTLLRRLSDD